MPDLPERLPGRLSAGPPGGEDYMEQLGLITFMLDGRINMPGSLPSGLSPWPQGRYQTSLAEFLNRRSASISEQDGFGRLAVGQGQ